MTRRLTRKKYVICIIGLGYVGLPLANAFAKTCNVIGIDIDQKKVKKLQGSDLGKSFVASTHPEDIKTADVIIICVPTLVTAHKEIDLSFVKGAAKTVGQHMRMGSLVVLESTVYPGVTEEIVKPILEKESGLKCGSDFKIGYSPERINPGDGEHTVEKTTKVVAGMDGETTEILAVLYGQITPGIFKAKDIRTAEAAKVIENIQRDLNIALVNELSIIFEKLGLNTREVLRAAESKWNFHRYYPGLVGGYCIPVNPYYLVHKAEELGYHPRVILAGREINNSVPERVAGMMVDALNKAGKTVKGSTVLVLGLTYKANVSDIRESATKQMVKALKDSGVQVAAFDPMVDEADLKNSWEEEFSLSMLTDFSRAKLAKVDGVILTVAHSAFRKISLSDLKHAQSKPPILIDVPGFYDPDQVRRDGFCYKTL